MLIIGIDPGIYGGLVGVDLATRLPVFAVPMPLDNENNDTSDKRICASTLHSYLINQGNEPVAVYCEDIFCGPVMARKTFLNMAQNHGRITAVLELLMLPYVLVRPSTWQATIFKRLSKTDKNGNKLTTKDLAHKIITQQFPTVKNNDRYSKKSWEGITDAACIALYGIELFILESSPLKAHLL